MLEEKKLIRYEDVYKYAFDGANGGSLEDEDFDAIVNAIESVPVVDAVEVVRCKDCKHLQYQDEEDDRGDCDIHDTWFTRTPESFCCYGERREE